MNDQQYRPCIYENYPQYIKDDLEKRPDGIVRACWECEKLFVATPHKPHFCSKECEELFNKKQFYYYGLTKRKRTRRSEPLVVAFESNKDKALFYEKHIIEDKIPKYYEDKFINNDLRTPEDERIIRNIARAPVADDEFLITIGPTMYDVRIVRTREEKINWDEYYRFEPYGYLRLFNDNGLYISVICCPEEEFKETLKRCLFCGKIHSNCWRMEYGDGYSFCSDHCLNIFKKIAREDQNRALQILYDHKNYNHL